MWCNEHRVQGNNPFRHLLAALQWTQPQKLSVAFAVGARSWLKFGLLPTNAIKSISEEGIKITETVATFKI